MRRAQVLAGLAALAIGTAAAYAYLRAPAADAVRVARKDVVQSVVASGRIAAPFRVDIGSQVVGTVAEVPVDQGQAVRAGQVLIRLDGTEARANLAQAQATMANAQAQYERNRKLFEAGFIGKSALDDLWQKLEVARTGVEAARAKLSYATITAPRDGVLIARDVERGDVVQAGKVLMVLSPAGETQVVLQIDERNLSRLRLGQPALASADAYPQERMPAEVVYINPGVDAQRGTVEVKLRIAHPPAYVKQDMTVSADIEVARSPGALAVPAEAVRDSAGAAPWVLVDRRGRAERRAVTLGLRGGGIVEIRSGLEEGDVVLAAGAAQVAPGRRVRPVLRD
ncbi:MAG TPA: efflux RND transporter periplasmic adaptor subunit [Burkholderiales bacterium]